MNLPSTYLLLSFKEGGGLNKSRTQILATPQFRETRKRKLYLTQEGNTKVKDGNARRLKKTANALAPIQPEKEKPRTPDNSDSISDEAKDEHTTDATRFHVEMWETNFNKMEPEEEPSSFNFISGNLELVDTIILKGDPG